MGSIQDKMDAIGVLYEEYGIQEVESTEVADLCEGMLKLYRVFDQKSFEEASAAEISSKTALKCWERLGIYASESISPNQLIAEEIKSESDSVHLSKSVKRAQLVETFEHSLKRLLHKKELFAFIKVAFQ
eukprot:TRINITY_DN6447_c0_g1_i1.p3 TRINITY_DN6447_c0_g1~~TRINITY_DN6447_c0_g1_i1.p3  ORF type:complete len:130 (+),score=48.36 TRINITY_DN6447_c0_g1_i1:969-1358(+)